MTLSDEEVRKFTIDLLTAPTARDLQTRIGISDLANGCEYCLACAFLGISRDTAAAKRPWGGAVVGTAIHLNNAERMNQGLAEYQAHLEHADHLDAAGEQIKLSALGQIAERFPDALVERHMVLSGFLGSYGDVGTTPDLILPGEREGIDWKGTTRIKMMRLKDFIARSQGLPEPYGRDHIWAAIHTLIAGTPEIPATEKKAAVPAKGAVYRKVGKGVSEAVYEEELLHLEYKITGYYRQLQGYGLTMEENGAPVDKLDIVFIARDDTMYFDNPALDRYDDPTALHGVSVLSFPYDREYALSNMERGKSIWEGLESGKTPADFERHPLCFPCSKDAEFALVESDAPIIDHVLAA